ncbi:MAG: hypothetical protein COA78_21650 [Blastopirellula sp.]|nr:MAG: hypothetical protein COA78_21650 [Blastopirellula sp.]
MAQSELAAITCYFNPVDYESRRVNYFRYAESLERQGISHWVIEAALPGSEFAIPKTDQVIQVRLPEEGWLWQKERLLNLLIKQLPSHITKVAWLDCDILFHNDNWGQE